MLSTDLLFVSDRMIRHRACTLKDTVHAIIKDELDENFEKICVELKESRLKRGPDLLVTHDLSPLSCTNYCRMSKD